MTVPKEPLSPCQQTLQRLMQRAKIPSQRALATRAEVSRWQVRQLHQGNLDTMRVSVLKQLATALDCSLMELLEAFNQLPSGSSDSAPDDTPDSAPENMQEAALRQEYTRLQQRLEQQAQELQHQFQSEALGVIESWLTYWPTAAKAATDVDGFDAKKLLPLVKPVERLVAHWGVTAIGTVGEELCYAPQHHQLARGMANPGDPVRISHVGYRHGDNLLQRAKVVPVGVGC
ncbi:helix-turn-helix transcriptional regulator [Leptolyngbya cf. ectocarpi LEGE 11479]|uniref:Helix-turn-helix transcriptional regulator n=1 Tax=Leptolyngbya cf. ectocarpi LEGE 11479 TaxID=1828722 RepID=A0A928ZR71_LEPEC|nr:helix-turn-helix transcriptional regulator [Leptolyngbya ectocarpi]MBE9066223.1 helix-turn-helix transcriptional regulator [Leptolyngbya cf. ectocarpi LEGE 11479]